MASTSLTADVWDETSLAMRLFLRRGVTQFSLSVAGNSRHAPCLSAIRVGDAVGVLLYGYMPMP
jgi:hypothetical protein